MSDNTNEKYKDKIQFYGIFPNSDITETRLTKFKEKYNLPFSLMKDEELAFVEKFDATITPEVILYNEEKEEILYQGRIDNAYAKLGRRRRIITHFELAQALQSLDRNETIETKKTQAVGCIIQIIKKL